MTSVRTSETRLRLKSTTAPRPIPAPETERPAVPPDMPGAFSIKSFLQTYGISRAKFYDEVRAGRIKLMKVGTRSLVSHRAALAWEKLCEGEVT
jgi:hypothetical protein